MSRTRVVVFTLLALLAFAGNSLLCRAALAQQQIDAATFTTVRLFSGAATLWIIVSVLGRLRSGAGNWISALSLFAYAACFSFSYLQLSAAVGALILFGAVQTSMIGYGIWRGERMRSIQIVGLGLACSGLVGLVMPGLSAPPLFGALLMLVAGIAWGIYSLRGKVGGNPLHTTTGNFLRAAPIGIALSVALIDQLSFNFEGIGYAVLSGALTSGVGYAIWYAALPSLRATTAATVQLSVPVITALGGVAFLQEAITMRLLVASTAIVGGVALVVLMGNRGAPPNKSPQNDATSRRTRA